MDYRSISKLVDKYFSGKTSLEEEALLKAYFSEEEIHESLLPYQSVFQFFSKEKEHSLSADFEDRILDLIQMEEAPPIKIRKLNAWWLRVAAAVVLALGVWFLYPGENAPEEVATTIDWSKYEAQSVDEAFKITRMALLKTSSELNHGAVKAATEVTRIQEVGKFFK